MAKFPVVPDDLLRSLEKSFPDKAPRQTDISLLEVGMLMGEQRVLDFLRSKHKQNNMLEG